VIEEHLFGGRVVAVWHFEKEVPRFDLVERSSRPLPGVLDDDFVRPRPLFRETDEERHRADVDLLAILHGHALPGRDALAAYERAVGTAAIFDEEIVVHANQQRVFARNLRVIDDDVVVGCAADRPIGRLALRKIELAYHRLMLFGAAACRRLCRRLHGDGNSERLCNLQKEPDRDRHRAERHDHARIGRHRALRRDARVTDRDARRRAEIGDRHLIASEHRVRFGDGGMLNDETRSRRIAADDELGWRVVLPARHQHEAYRRVRERYLRLADGERRNEVEGNRLSRRDGASPRRRGPLTVVREDELPVPLMNDARVMGGYAGRREDDVTVGGTPDQNGLLSKSGNHGRIESITLSSRCRVPSKFERSGGG
jgi:hypothetical protein